MIRSGAVARLTPILHQGFFSASNVFIRSESASELRKNNTRLAVSPVHLCISVDPYENAGESDTWTK